MNGHLPMTTPQIVSPQEWEAARQRLLVNERELTRARDALAAQRRRMPWMAVEKDYEFDGPKGTASLLELFEGRRQLIVYRAFFEPGVAGWPEHACIGCSIVADQFDADFGVDEWNGANAFIRDGARVFRTYFINSRGVEALGSVWSFLDMTALGRQEEWEARRRATRKRRRTSGGDDVQHPQPPQEVREAATRPGLTPTLEARGHDELEARVTRSYEEFIASGEFVFRGRANADRLGDVVKFNCEIDRSLTASAASSPAGPGSVMGVRAHVHAESGVCHDRPAAVHLPCVHRYEPGRVHRPYQR